LFNIVERSGNYVFEDDNPPPPIVFRKRVVSYAFGAFNVFIEIFVIEASKGSFDWKLRGLVPFLLVESDQSDHLKIKIY
jgi:hypothetical protein